MLGLTLSPFISEETLDVHFVKYGQEPRELVKKIGDDMYLDDFVTGGESINEVKTLKSNSISLFRQGGTHVSKSCRKYQNLSQ